ncbi:hypothetical protein LJY25_12510 [Hymenobacter sp. BT175]|uniref:hypothetical protein n=1 Tax=Hymenobacter translucens TaxID=2886507 RepID=UPI001D0F1FBB|nr:hypothetical protein [Hymenobacter translucens]MCC2547270.1 hypothetical protein [Hymenobacter translucens]
MTTDPQNSASPADDAPQTNPLVGPPSDGPGRLPGTDDQQPAPEAEALTQRQVPQKGLDSGQDSGAKGESYGGNMSNSTQGSYRDSDRIENQLSSPGRGEFGPQGPGSTQGGYGDQFRGDETYNGELGRQGATRGGYDGGHPINNTGSEEQDPQGSTFGHQPGSPQAGTTVDPHYRNDNASPQAPSSGFSEDYGRTSLGGAAGARPAADKAGEPVRNQTEDYIPAQPDGSGLNPGVSYTPEPTRHGSGEGLNGLNEAGRPATGPAADRQEAAGSRTGYTKSAGEASFQGSETAGVGSRGGSYNDPVDTMNPAAGAASPTKDDYRRDRQDQTAQQTPKQDDDADYGPAPRRAADRNEEPDKQ